MLKWPGLPKRCSLQLGQSPVMIHYHDDETEGGTSVNYSQRISDGERVEALSDAEVEVARHQSTVPTTKPPSTSIRS